jgi:hypothetical protein
MPSARRLPHAVSPAASGIQFRGVATPLESVFDPLRIYKPELPLSDDRVQRLGHFALLPALRAERNGHCFRRRFGRTSRIASQREQPVEWFRRGGTAAWRRARYSMRDLQ